MKKISIAFQFAMAGVMLIYTTSCKKNDDENIVAPEIPLEIYSTAIPTADTAGTLKAKTAAFFPNMGMAVTYGPMLNSAAYLATVKREANNITFGNELKEGSVVRNNGAYDFTTADALYNICANNGLQVFGHTLVWYSQQNATYLNSLIAPKSTGTVATNVLANGTFEAVNGTDVANWNKFNGGNSFSAGTGANEVRTGSHSLKVVVAASGTAYSVQLASDLFNTTVGTTYTMTFYIKAASAGGKMRISTQPTAQYSADYNTTTDWAPYTYTFTAREAQTRVLFDIGYAANTYFIDDVTVTYQTSGGPATALTDAQKTAAIDGEMKKYIVTAMQRYAGKIKAWDVVNEVFLDNGAVRTSSNYTIPTANITNQFLYGQYIGSKYDNNNYVLKAFQYAKEADPTALRFINDYNLEYSRAKTDSMKALVTFINQRGALVDGIGTQMHLNINTDPNAVDYMFKTLASTGLKIRISELDIVLNGAKQAPFAPSVNALELQRKLYKYVIQSYIKNVPAIQRYGVTVWGVADSDSWLNTPTSPDFPLLFDSNYKKKLAYAGFTQGLTPQ
ncbi:endo-1,4-beta-xylanase [Mucilaginibacter sp. PAMB04274]|uniref:endo-1,4-beta-xylanase n=1 Tax=Mucilaginibacter sp. PAMB04274 TaxID=3138568 RepID=UPI0031F6B771